ncbi:ABC transporter ATP-binding protein [soil metagenome]
MPKDIKPTGQQVIRYYWGCAKRYPRFIIGTLIGVPFASIINNFIPPLILANVLHRLSDNDYIVGHPWQSFSHEIILYSVLVISGGILAWRFVDYCNWHLEGNVQRDIAREVFDSLENQSADFHANRFSGSLVAQTNRLVGSYVRIADTTMFSTIPLISSLAVASIILWPRSPLFVIFLIVFAVLFITTAYLMTQRNRNIFAKHAAADSVQTGYLADVTGNVMAVKSFAGEDFESSEFKKITETTRKKLMEVMRVQQRTFAYFGSVSSTISAGSFILAIISVVSFKADIATVFLILNYTANIVSQLFQFSNNSLRNYNRAIGDASDMVGILALRPEIEDPDEPEKVAMNRGAIKFKDVTFTHKGAGHAIFSGLDLRVKPGEKVGLIGHSGSGKTSLTRILLRFSDIDSGTIEIDGQNIANVTQADLRRAISYVPQEPILFHRTISENIGYGRPGAERKEIEAIARQANAGEFITGLQHGYDTIVGERGVKLSGGQRQRVAIARAMLKNAPILVLDEATSALDSESEGLIQDALWKLMEGRTAIVIAHRLSTIQKMDRIIVMDDGKIVEEGSHKDLLYKKGIYASLWNRQSGGFLED